jgi:hypothetical protein
MNFRRTSLLLVVVAVCFSFFLTADVVSAADAVGVPVAITWDPNVEAGVTGYYVHVGTSAGVYSNRYEVRGSTVFVFYDGLVGQTYHFAVSAFDGASHESQKSSDIATTVVAFPELPSAPAFSGGSGGGSGGGGGSTGGATGGTGTTSTSNGLPSGGTTNRTTLPAGASGVLLQPAVVTGTQVSLQWAAVGVPVIEYVIEAGSAPGLSNLYNGSVGLTNQLTANVDAGTYFVRLRARTGAQTSVTSNEITFSSGFESISSCSAPPPTPTQLTGGVTGTTASLSWNASAGATSYIVQAGTASGLSNVFYGDVGGAPTVSAGVSAGFSAYVRVVAVNACGQSAASAEMFLR